MWYLDAVFNTPLWPCFLCVAPELLMFVWQVDLDSVRLTDCWPGAEWRWSYHAKRTENWITSSLFERTMALRLSCFYELMRLQHADQPLPWNRTAAEGTFRAHKFWLCQVVETSALYWAKFIAASAAFLICCVLFDHDYEGWGHIAARLHVFAMAFWLFFGIYWLWCLSDMAHALLFRLRHLCHWQNSGFPFPSPDNVVFNFCMEMRACLLVYFCRVLFLPQTHYAFGTYNVSAFAYVCCNSPLQLGLQYLFNCSLDACVVGVTCPDKYATVYEQPEKALKHRRRGQPLKQKQKDIHSTSTSTSASASASAYSPAFTAFVTDAINHPASPTAAVALASCQALKICCLAPLADVLGLVPVVVLQFCCAAPFVFAADVSEQRRFQVFGYETYVCVAWLFGGFWEWCLFHSSSGFHANEPAFFVLLMSVFLRVGFRQCCSLKDKVGEQTNTTWTIAKDSLSFCCRALFPLSTRPGAPSVAPAVATMEAAAAASKSSLCLETSNRQPAAASIVTSARAYKSSKTAKLCIVCEQPSTQGCPTCHTPFCSSDCQLKMWPQHKSICLQLAEERKQRKKLAKRNL